MSAKKSIWFHIGHALERARLAPDRGKKRSLSGLAERAAEVLPERAVDKRPERNERGLPVLSDALPELPQADELVAASIAIAVDQLLARWTGARTPTVAGLVRACAAGATAAILVDLVRPLLRGDDRVGALDDGVADRLLSGVGQGLVYGGVIEPRLPGPALIKGAVYGSAEYASDPVGGLASLLGSHTPQRRIPFIGELVDRAEPHERAYLEHLVFGIALAILYDSSPSRSGIDHEDEE